VWGVAVSGRNYIIYGQQGGIKKASRLFTLSDEKLSAEQLHSIIEKAYYVDRHRHIG
jgi:hypothetical protein